jgi:hypothetical protein
MNKLYGSTHGELVIELMQVFHGHVGLMGSAGGARAVMSTAAQMHKDAARPILAIGLAERSDAWTLLEASALNFTSAVTQALSLSGRHAQELSKEMELSPIALSVGEARTYTAVHSREQLKAILRTEPELVAKLTSEGNTLLVADKVRALIAAAPDYLIEEIIQVAQNAKYAEAHQKARITVDGETTTVKAHAFANMSHLLSKSGNAWRLLNGMNNFIQSSLKLTHRWAETALWWSEVEAAKQPVIEHGEEDRGYAGGEDTFFSSPLKTYTIGGEWGRMDQWLAKEAAKADMVDDYTSAAAEAEELLTAISGLLEAAKLEVIYAWKFAGEGVFIPMHSRVEAENMMVQRTIDYRATQVANTLDLDAQHMEQYGLVPTILAEFDEATAAKIIALRKEYGHES